MSKSNITPPGSASIKRPFLLTSQNRTPKPLSWFRKRGYKKADPAYTNGHPVWLHPENNDVLGSYGQKLPLQLVPYEKFKPNATQYLKLTGRYGDMYLARLKYITFIKPIPEGKTIDHIDGNPLNNAIWNLRAVPRAINYRDGGFLKKLRNQGINVAMYHTGIILMGYKRMAKWREIHTQYAYDRLTRTDLLQIFLGPDFRVDPRSTDDIMLAEMSHHMEL